MKGQENMKNQIQNNFKHNHKTHKTLKTVLIVTGCIALGLGSFVGGALYGYQEAVKAMKKNDENNNNDFSVSEAKGIKIRLLSTMSNADGTVTKVVGYTLDPKEAVVTDFNAGLDWNRGDDSEYDWEYDPNRKVEDYMAYSIDSVNKTITFTCKKAFGRKINFDLSLKDNPSVKAGLLIDYERKVLTPYSIAFENNAFADGKPVKINTVSSAYSVGTKGLREDKFALSVDYDSSKVSFRSLFGEALNPSTYSSGTYYYKGVAYTNKDKFLDTLSSAVDEYMKGCITLDGSVDFSKREFTDLASFQYVMYHTYKDEFGTSGTIASDFINNYKAAIKKGSGYRAKVSVNGSEKFNSLVDMNLNAQIVNSIQLSDGAISF